MFKLGDDNIELQKLFPFYFILDEHLMLLEAGRSLRKLQAEIEGRSLLDCFTIIRPTKTDKTFQGILEVTDQLFILLLHTKEITFRGQFIPLASSHKLLFVGGPWITNIAQLPEYSLVMSDFSLCDPSIDMTQLIMTHEINVQDMRVLNEKLSNQKKILQEKEESYRLLVESANDAIFKLDANGLFTYVNPVTEKITGYTAAELIGMASTILIYQEDRPKIFKLLRDQVNTLIQQTYAEFRIRHKNGSEVWIAQNTMVIMHDNHVKGYTAVGRDITKQKELERELIEARQKALDSMYAKERFLANTSHEIRTPMNAIIGLSNLLSNQVKETKQLEFVNAIQTSAENLLHIINDILDISKIESGKLSLEHVSFNLKQHLQSLIKPLEIKASEKNLMVGLEWDEKINPFLKGDPHRLGQIITNLMSNAFKFTESGSVTLIVKLNNKTTAEQNIQISVKDTGIGIPSDKLDKIFDDFSQADDSITRRFGGTGLGLSISKKLASLMNANIEVQSSPGEGSEFIFRVSFPYAEELEETTTIELPDCIHFANKNILLVEDNNFNRILAMSILEMWNMQVDIAENGMIALEKIKHRTLHYDLILMDIQMPVMGGEEATKIIRSELEVNTPIIALTANAMKEDVEHYLNAGMNLCITKPFKEDELQWAIYNMLTL